MRDDHRMKDSLKLLISLNYKFRTVCLKDSTCREGDKKRRSWSMYDSALPALSIREQILSYSILSSPSSAEPKERHT